MQDPSSPDKEESTFLLVEGKLVWDQLTCGLMLVVEGEHLYCGALVPPTFEGKTVRILVEVLDEKEADTDPAPAPSSP